MMGGDNFSLDSPNRDAHFRLSRLAIDAKVPVAIWGASVGPFTRNPSYEHWAAKELRKVTLICARETATVKYLESIGVSKNVLLTADPAFYLQPTACDLPADIDKILVEGCIGLNLSPLLSKFVKLPGSEPNLSAWIKVAVEIVRNLLNQFSLPMLLVPHVTSEVGDVYRDDYLFLSRVAQSLNGAEGVFILGPNLNAAQTKWVISRLRAFAGARTHSTLAAISSHVPTICIGYSMKARGIAQDVYGQLDWLISGQDLVKDPSILRDRFVSLLSQETAIRMQLENVNPIMHQRAMAGAERISEIIMSRVGEIA
jgi:colanic acid/amylovoran biosynthesis protein